MFGLHITILTGQDQGKTVTVRPPEGILGRAPTCAVSLSTRGVSNQHAMLQCLEGPGLDGTAWTLRDLGSTNGTFIDDVQIGPAPVPLPSEGIFRLGSNELRFKRIRLARTAPGIDEKVPETVVGTVGALLGNERIVQLAHPVPDQMWLRDEQERLEQQQRRLELEARVQALTEERDALQAVRHKLEHDVDGMKRSSEILWKENRTLQQRNEALAASHAQAEKTIVHLNEELAVLQARVAPLERHLAAMREKYTLIQALNDTLSKQMPEVHREGRLLNVLWREAGVLRVQSNRLEQQNLLLHEQEARLLNQVNTTGGQQERNGMT